jgi:hypothetical protein
MIAVASEPKVVSLLRQRVDALKEHPLHRLAEDLLVILQRLFAQDASVIPAELRAFHDELTQWEEGHLPKCLAAWLDVIERNREADQSKPRILHARDFGARGDGQHDDTAALMAAVRAATGAGPGTVLRLHAGRYRLAAPPAGTRHHLLIAGARDIVIEGEPGTELIATADGPAILWLEDCHNVRLRNITMDYDPLTSSEGRILEIAPDRTWLVWQAEPGLPEPDGVPFKDLKSLGGCPLNAAGHLLSNAHGAFKADRWERLGDRKWKLFCPTHRPLRPDVAVDSTLVLLTRRDAAHAFVISACQWVDVENINVHAAYEFAVFIESSTGVSFLRCNLEPRAGRSCGLNADGFHARSNRFGPFFVDCRIHRLADDCFNLYSRMVSVDDATADGRTVVLDLSWDSAGRAFHWEPQRCDFAVGDILLFIDPTNGIPAGHAIIEATEPREWHGRTHLAARLDRPVPGLVTREGIGQHCPVASNMTFLSPDPQAPIEHFTINASTKSDGFVIRGCFMGDNTVTGGKIKAGNGIIAGNHHVRHGWCGWSFASEANWQEGFAARRILVEDNVFDTWFGIFCGSGYVRSSSQIGPAWGCQIDVVNNTFAKIAERELALDVNSIAGCRIRGNVLPASRPIAIGPTASAVVFEENTIAT